jgi:hypothetical protein
MTLYSTCAKEVLSPIQLPYEFGTKIDADSFHLKVIGKIIESNEALLRSDVLEN